MTGWRSRRWLVALPVLVALVALVAGLGQQPRGSQLRGARLTVAQEKLVERAAGAARTSAARLRAEGAAPTCPPPPLPAPVEPDGVHGYGVPFVAELANATILSGYSEWAADNTTWVAGSQTYRQYPWASSLSGLSGWISGTLDFPSLSAEIPASNIDFCDQGGTACFNALPDRPVGQCLDISLGQGAKLAPGIQPGAPETNLPLDPVTLSGPSALAPNQSGTYTFTAPSRDHLSTGITATFSGQTVSGRPVSATGTTYYAAFPYDAYPSQFFQVSNETINGKPAALAPGPQVAPGSTVTVGVTVKNPSTETVFLGTVERYDDVLNSVPPNVVLRPGKSATVTFTTTAGPAGAQAVMVEAQGTLRSNAEPAQGFGTAYYTSGPVPPDLAVSNQTVDGQPAAASPGPEVGSTYTAQVTLTNKGSSPITGIKGVTASAPCWNISCLHYLVTLQPTGTATLKVTGVAPDGSLQLAGTASSLTTVTEYFTPTLSFPAVQVDPHGNPEPTTVSLSSQLGPLPAGGPSPPSPGNPDDRGIQVAPQGLHGPFQGASATVAGNDFPVPAFTNTGPLGPASNLNTALAGWDANGNQIWPNCVPGQCPLIAGQPGWNQFSAQAVVSQVGLPQGVPSQFNW